MTEPQPPRVPLIVGGEELPEALEPAWRQLCAHLVDCAIDLAQRQAREAEAAEAEQPAELAS